MSIREKVIDLIRNKATSLPTLPVVINNIIVTAKNESATPDDLACFIANDQSLTARVLKIANSPYYGLSKRIDSISRAIMIIGFKEVVSVALGSGVFKSLSASTANGLIDVNDLWRHSIGVGFTSMQIEKVTGNRTDEATMLVGLLHDMGKILFLKYFQADYAEVLVKHQLDRRPLHSVENEILGIDHAEMAYLLMKQWNFPDSISIPIRYHHNLSGCPYEHLNRAMTANLGNLLCNAVSIGHSADISKEKREDVISALGVSAAQLEEIRETLLTSKPRIDAFLEALS